MEQLDKATRKGSEGCQSKAANRKEVWKQGERFYQNRKEATLTKKSKIQKGVYAGSIQSLDNMRSKHVKEVQGIGRYHGFRPSDIGL
jgi:hypothetical protein